MNNLINHFTKNLKGKDYVVGDIHGMFKNLYSLLKSIGFNFEHDRLFSVGDLCDRGPDSLNIIQWLKYPWFFPILGNHEQALLMYESKQYPETEFLKMGGAWWLSVDKKSKKEIVQAYKNLPIAIEVETDTGLVGIIHAYCPHANWNELNNVFTGINRVKMKNKALWSMEAPLHNDIIKNVKAVIVGHMTQKNYIINGNVHLIDTGACNPNGFFTILELETLSVIS